MQRLFHQNHNSQPQCHVLKKKNFISNFSFVLWFHRPSESSSFQVCVVTVACSEGLRQKCQYFSLHCDLFFLYQTLIGQNEKTAILE